MGSGGTDLGSAHGEVRISYDDGPIGGAMSQITDLGVLVGGVAAGIGLAFVAGAAVAAGALASVAVSGLNMARDLEQQLADIQSVMGATGDEVLLLKDHILELGLDPNLKVSATEAADAIEALGRNGLEVDEILEGAAEATVLLANATGAEFTTAANIASDAMALWNIEASDMTGVVDNIAAVTTNSKFTIEDFALALAQGGGVAAASGVSFEDLAVTVASISPYFASGSDAGTSFKTMLQRLVNPTDQAKTAMADLGLYTEESGSAFFDAQGNMLPMSEIAGLLSGAIAGLSEEQQGMAFSTIFGADAIRAATAIAELGEDGFLALSGAMGETDAAEMAATRMDTLSGAMEILQGVIDTVKIKIGDALIPIVRTLAEAVTEFINEHGDQLVAFFETLADIIIAFISGAPGDYPWEDIFPPWLADRMYDISAIFEGVLQVIEDWKAGKIGLDTNWADYFPSWLVPIIEGIADAIDFVRENADMFKAALQALGVVLAGAGIVALIGGIIAVITNLINPITLVLAAIAGLAMAWENDWGGIRTKLTTAWAAIEPILTQLWQIIQTVGQYFLSVVRDGDTMNEWLDALPPAIQPVVEAFGEALAAVIEMFQGIVQWVQAQGAAIGDWFAENEELIDRFMLVVQDVAAVLGVLIGIILVVAATMIEQWARMWTIVEPILDILITTILAVVEAFMEIVTGDWAAALETFGQLFEDLIPLFAEVGQAILDWLFGWFGLTFEEAVYALVDYLDSAWDDMVAIWNGIKTSISNKLREILAGIEAGVSSIGQAWDSFWDGVADAIVGKWNEIKKTISDKFTQTKDSVVGIASSLGSSLQTAWDNLKATASTKWEDIKAAATTKWQSIKDAIALKITEAKDGVIGIVTSIQSSLTNIWTSIRTLASTWWQSIKDTIALKMTEAWNSITGIGSQMVAAVSNLYSNFLEAGRNMINGIIQGLQQRAYQLLSYIRDLAYQVLQEILDFFGITSPSREFEFVGEMLMEGLLVGLEAGEAGVRAVVDDIISLLQGGGQLDVIANSVLGGGDLASKLWDNQLSAQPSFSPVFSPTLTTQRPIQIYGDIIMPAGSDAQSILDYLGRIQE